MEIAPRGLDGGERGQWADSQHDMLLQTTSLPDSGHVQLQWGRWGKAGCVIFSSSSVDKMAGAWYKQPSAGGRASASPFFSTCHV